MSRLPTERVVAQNLVDAVVRPVGPEEYLWLF